MKAMAPPPASAPATGGRPSGMAPPAPSASGGAARRAWTAVGLALALVAVGIWVGRTVVVQFRNSYAAIPLHERVYTGPVHRLVVAVDSGVVTIEPASGSATVVQTTGTRAVRTPTDDEHLVGTTLFLRSSCGPPTGQTNYCTRNFRVRVPPHVAVEVNVGTGAVAIAGIDGTIRASLGGGNLTVSRGVGSWTLATGSGNIEVDHGDGSLSASTGTGNITLEDARGPVALRSSVGNVAVVDAATSLRITAGTGNVVATGLSGATVSATVLSGAVSLDFTAPPRSVDATSRTGDVVVRIPFGSVRYKLQLRSDTGRVISAVPSNPTSTRVIRALTANGDVVVGEPAPVPGAPTAPGLPSTPGAPSATGLG